MQKTSNVRSSVAKIFKCPKKSNLIILWRDKINWQMKLSRMGWRDFTFGMTSKATWPKSLTFSAKISCFARFRKKKELTCFGDRFINRELKHRRFWATGGNRKAAVIVFSAFSAATRMRWKVPRFSVCKLILPQAAQTLFVIYVRDNNCVTFWAV